MAVGHVIAADCHGTQVYFPPNEEAATLQDTLVDAEKPGSPQPQPPRQQGETQEPPPTEPMRGKTTGEQVDVPEPPKPLSDGAIRSRLNRLLKRRANGSSLVPEEVLVDWESEDTRNTIKKMFEKAGYDKDPTIELCLSYVL